MPVIGFRDQGTGGNDLGSSPPSASPGAGRPDLAASTEPCQELHQEGGQGCEGLLGILGRSGLLIRFGASRCGGLIVPTFSFYFRRKGFSGLWGATAALLLFCLATRLRVPNTNPPSLVATPGAPTPLTKLSAQIRRTSIISSNSHDSNRVNRLMRRAENP